MNSKGVKYCFKNDSRKAVYTAEECPNLFYGRGYVQLTWYDNYLRAGSELGVDLVKNPELALQPEIAAKIMRLGIVGGWFTGRKLAHYFSGSLKDFVNAHAIINGDVKKNGQ